MFYTMRDTENFLTTTCQQALPLMCIGLLKAPPLIYIYSWQFVIEDQSEDTRINICFYAQKYSSFV